MKTTITLFAINTAMTRLFKINDVRILIFPLTLICLLLSLVMFKNEAEFSEEVTVVWPLTNIVIGVIPLLLIVLISMLKTTFHKN